MTLTFPVHIDSSLSSERRFYHSPKIQYLDAVAVQATDDIQNLKKHIQKAYFCMLSVAPMETENVQRCHIVEPGGGGAKGSKQASQLVSIATRWEYF
jgi:hypothetical protein